MTDPTVKWDLCHQLHRASSASVQRLHNELLDPLSNHFLSPFDSAMAKKRVLPSSSFVQLEPKEATGDWEGL
jgi:hypothetical protein